MDWYVYLIILEGIVIVSMLGWEIFWLRKMWQALQSLPAKEQVASLAEGFKKNSDEVKVMLSSISNLAHLAAGFLSQQKNLSQKEKE